MDYKGFVGGSTLARVTDGSPARCINLYPHAFSTEPPQRGLVSLPGLRRVATLPQPCIRGLYTATNNRVFCVAGNVLYELAAAGPAVERGRLDTRLGVVSLTDNGLMLALVDGTHGYGLTFDSNAFGRNQDPDFRGGTTIGFLDGRFVWDIPGTGQYQWSELYSPSIDGLAFATAEARADPLVGLRVDHRELWLFGTQTTEVLYSTGDPFTPFQRLPGAVQEVGSVGPHASASLHNTLFWVTHSPRGAGQVVMAQGYQPQRISTPALEATLQQSTRLQEAVGVTYTQEGHSWYVLYVPDLETTWAYDLTTETWSERGSLWPNSVQVTGADPRWYPWRPYLHTFAFGEHLWGSWEHAIVYALDPMVYTDDERELVRERTAPPIRQEQEWLQIHRVRVQMATGVGLEGGVVPGTDPQVTLEVSHDGGHVWRSARWASARPQGQYGQTVEWRRLGRARQWVMRVRCSEPVPVTFLGASVC